MAVMRGTDPIVEKIEDANDQLGAFKRNLEGLNKSGNVPEEKKQINAKASEEISTTLATLMNVLLKAKNQNNLGPASQNENEQADTQVRRPGP
jgi:hypothetical protein